MYKAMALAKRNKTEFNRIVKQKLMGLGMLLLCVAVVMVAMQGESMRDRDVTPILFLAPIGLIMLFSKEDALM